MRPLLIAIDAKYIHTNNAVRLLKANSDYNVDIMTFTIKDEKENILDYIKKQRPLFVGISTYIWNVEIVKTLMPSIRDLHIPIVLGGPEVSYEPLHFLNQGADLIVKGEGEAVFDKIIEHYRDGKPLKNTPNIAYMDDEFINNPIKQIAPLSSLASAHTFEEDIPHIPRRIQYIESSRGCPFRCTYCLSSLEKSIRHRPPGHVKKDIDRLLKHGARTIKFLDRTFNASKNALDIIDYIIEKAPGNTVFQFEMTGDNIDEALIEHIHARAPKGLFRFEIGIQSVSERVNALVERNQNTEKLLKTLKKIEDLGVIDLHLDLIAGLPGENLKTFKWSFDHVFAIGAKELQLGFLKLLRGTKLRKQADSFGIRYENRAPYEVIETAELSKEDLRVIKRVETALNIFHNRGYFQNTLSEIIINHFDRYFDLFHELYISYKEKGLPLKGYQLHELYGFIHEYLKGSVPAKALDELKYTYLKRAKTKPKPYFSTIEDKALRHKVFNEIRKHHDIPLDTLFKHTVTTHYTSYYLVALYKDNQATLYTIEKG